MLLARVIDERLHELQRCNKRFASFARIPVSEREIAEFEMRHGITLPPAHRVLLATFGDQPIVPRVIGGRALALEACTGDPIYRSFSGPLADPFPYQGTEPIALGWDDDADDYVDAAPLRGTLCLGSGGCDVVYVLVVTGHEPGRVWSFLPSHEQELHPTGLGVLEWCLQSLEARIEEERRWLESRR